MSLSLVLLKITLKIMLKNIPFERCSISIKNFYKIMWKRAAKVV